ncbi:MAG: M20 aminoacylase family protein [Burkholderiaceae bacterium]
MHDEMKRWRRHLHAHPELGFHEFGTSDFVADKLAAFGCTVHRGIGGTGLVGTLRTGTGARTLGLRADMDALPIEEKNDFEHRSKYPGRMHACGHDGHTTMLLGAAKYLCETRRFQGTVHFIFQPAEEGLGGARAMLADKLFERFPCDAIFAMHNRPSLPRGRFAVGSGPVLAAGASFDIHVKGKGTHGARPEAGIDPVMVASHIAIALQTIVSRNMPPVETAVLSVTRIQAGDAYNVTPQTASLAGTARAFSREAMALIESSMRRVCSGVAAAFGATVEVAFNLQFAPTVNDPSQAEVAAQICKAIVGPENVDCRPKPLMASEDFSFMLEKIPGCYVLIGTGAPGGSCEVHNPAYDFNDGALPLGAAFFARLVEDQLRF